MKHLFFLFLLFGFGNTGIAQSDDDYKKFPVFNYQKVVEKIFNATFLKKNEFLWKPNYEELQSFASAVSSDGYCHTKLDTAFDIVTKEAKYMLLVFSSIRYVKGVKDDCHICAPVISAVMFKKENDNSFTLEGFKKGFTAFGGFGDSGPYALEKIGDNTYALALESGYMGQGVYQSSRTFYLLTNGTFLKDIFSYEKDFNDGGAMGNTDKKTSMKTIPAPQSAFYTITLTTTGAPKAKGPVKETYKYSDQAGRYLPVK